MKHLGWLHAPPVRGALTKETLEQMLAGLVKQAGSTPKKLSVQTIVKQKANHDSANDEAHAESSAKVERIRKG